MYKDFSKWSALKEKLNDLKNKAPLFKDGEIWWCSIGINIGSEVDGKSRLFSRPIIALKKLSDDSFVGVPMTGKIKSGSWYVLLTCNGKASCANLAQIRSFNYKRMSDKYGQLDDGSFKNIKDRLRMLLIL